MARSYMRRNPSIEDFAVLVEQLGEARLAHLIRKYADDPDVRPALEMVAGLAFEVVGGAAEAPLADRDAWHMLADLIETFEMPAAQRRAYAEAFRAAAAAA